MNTSLSGSAWVDDIKGHPQGEIRGLTKLVNISEEEALRVGLAQKAKEFVEKGSEFTFRKIDIPPKRRPPRPKGTNFNV